MATSSKVKREAIDHYRKPGTPTTNKTFDAEFEKEIDAWADADADASEREVQWFRRVTREFTRQEVKKRAKLKNRKAAGADQAVNTFMKYGGEGMFSTMGRIV